MHFSRFLPISLASLVSVNAYRDTSPFFFFSTNDIPTTSQQLQSASSLLNDVSSKLSACPSESYVLVSQPGVNAQDYRSRKSAPRLRERVVQKDSAVKSSSAVSEVVGDFDLNSLQALVESKCGSEVVTVDAASGTLPKLSRKQSQIIKVDFPSLPTDSRRAGQLVDNDSFLSAIIEHLPSSSYTVLYTTTPGDASIFSPIDDSLPYEMDSDSYQNPFNMALKRDVSSHISREDSGDDILNSNLPLFEKYQFLSPGIFMGLLVGLLLLSIIYVGLSALTSLKVSYAAFTKEAGSGSNKKQQ